MTKQTNTKRDIEVCIVILMIVGFLSLTGTNFYIKDSWNEKNINVNGCQTIKDIYRQSVEIYCDVSSSGFCYGNGFGNCDGEVTYAPLSNEVGNSKSDDLRICGIGKCTIRYATKKLSIKSDVFK